MADRRGGSQSQRRPMTSESSSQAQQKEVELGSVAQDQEEKPGEDQGGMVSSGLWC